MNEDLEKVNEEIDREIFASEYNQLMRDETYKNMVEYYKSMNLKIKDEVEAYYLSGEYEQQFFNEKNAAAEVIKILESVKEYLRSVESFGKKYLLKEIEELIEGHKCMIRNSMGGLSNGITMSVYTYTDLQIRKANAIKSVIDFYENMKNSLKKGEEEKV